MSKDPNSPSISRRDLLKLGVGLSATAGAAAWYANSGDPNTADPSEYMEVLERYIKKTPQWETPAEHLPDVLEADCRRAVTKHIDRRLSEFVIVDPDLPLDKQKTQRASSRLNAIDHYTNTWKHWIAREILLHPEHVSNRGLRERVAVIQHDLPQAVKNLQPLVDAVARAEASVLLVGADERDRGLIPSEEDRLRYHRGRLENAVELARRGDMPALGNALHALTHRADSALDPEDVTLPQAPVARPAADIPLQVQAVERFQQAQHVLEETIRPYAIAIQPALLEQRFRQHQQQLSGQWKGR